MPESEEVRKRLVQRKDDVDIGTVLERIERFKDKYVRTEQQRAPHAVIHRHPPAPAVTRRHPPPPAATRRHPPPPAATRRHPPPPAATRRHP